jgi:excinuclease ABC subunit A
LNKALKDLKELGNTLILVEHDPQTVRTADYVLDFGPQAGNQGGHIVAKGNLKQILKDRKSLTGAYLSGKVAIPPAEEYRPLENGWLKIRQASAHNLKNVDIDIPLGVITCLTGVSGSGKSTLMHQVILPAVSRGLLAKDTIYLSESMHVSGIDKLDKLLSIDQNPIGHTSRSDVGTYVEILARLREFFASLPAARAKGLQPKHFSYNHHRGMCSGCWGLGYRKIEMHFLAPVKVVCEECKGLRLNKISLEVNYLGKNFGQFLDATVDEARQLFQNHPRIVRILDTLISVGLGYLKLGQEIVSLSGGEAQRLKLSRELAKRATGKTLYLLDEPTTGLHSEDIKKLLKVLHKLADKGNTIVIIEHNLDVIKNADYVIDLGPEAGEKGGEVVYAGTPKQLADHPDSWTGHYLSK